MTTEATNEAQNTDTSANAEVNNGAYQTDNRSADDLRADKATLLFGEEGKSEEGDDKAKGDEGKEDDTASTDDDSSKQDEKTDDKDSDSDDDTKEKEGAPEEYEEFTTPEGVELDTEVTGELKTLAKELNLSQKDAQRLADLGLKQASKFSEQPNKIVADAKIEWEKQTQNDEEIGGRKLAENLSVAKKAMNAYGSDNLKTLLNESGLGNHPDVIRFMYRAGKAISEDTIVRGAGNDTPKPKSAADMLYGN